MSAKFNRNYFVKAMAFITIALMTITLFVSQAKAQGNPNPGVLPIHSHSFGKSYGEWSAAWWQWAISIPASVNPILDTTGANCGQGQSGKVWFLAGTSGTSEVRNCTIPSGKGIFFPVLNVVGGSGAFDCDPTVPGVPCDVDAIRALAAFLMDNAGTLEVEVDGVPLQNVAGYRAQSPVFSIFHPADSIFGVAEGTYFPQVSDGYWIMLAPLSRGMHTIHFKASIPIFGFETEVTYFINIGN